MDKEKEIWRDIANYRGHYQVSNMGRIKSLKPGNAFYGKIRKQVLERSGYMRVYLFVGGGVKKYLVHRLVVGAFVGLKNGLVIDHIDNNKKNNALSNLDQVTCAENSRRARVDGLMSIGENRPATNLKNCEVELIKRILVAKNNKEIKITHSGIAEIFKCSRKAVNQINTGETWGHI